MLIDWFTVLAQIVNFLILVALLKYFLYGRILQAMDRREERIASRLAAAEQREREADDELKHYQARLDELEGQQAEILARAREDAATERKKLLHEARDEVDAVKSRWYEGIEREKSSFLQDLQQRAGRQVYAIARRALADLANAQLEQQIIKAFLNRLEGLPPEKRRELAKALASDTEVTITSAFTLPEEAKQKIDEILKGYLGDGLDLRYFTSSEVISGIEVKIPGHKIAWSLNNYLETLEAEIRETLEEKIST